MTDGLHQLSTQLSQEGIAKTVPTPAKLEKRVNSLSAQARAAIPQDWQKTDAGADLDVICTQLDAVVAAAGAVLSGTAIGLASVVAVGVAVLKWQAKLPMKKLLVWTGALICVVLGVMVGNTAHILQLVGWLPVHPLPLELPAWWGLWFGLHPSWEGFALQVLSVVAVIGSFFAAEALKKREIKAKRQKGAALSS